MPTDISPALIDETEGTRLTDFQITEFMTLDPDGIFIQSCNIGTDTIDQGLMTLSIMALR